MISNHIAAQTIRGRVVSLHVHPSVAGEKLIEAAEFNLIAEKGIREDTRYFNRSRNGKPAKRQVTLIEREVIQQHADALGADFDAGAVRSNIETAGIDLIAVLGCDVKLGEAVLRFVEARTPCHKMDALASGLKALMENNRQGVIAMVIESGRVRPGDAIELIAPAKRSSQPAFPLETS